MSFPTSSFTIRSIKASETWPLRHRVMWPSKPLDYVKVADDAKGQHYGLFLNSSNSSKGVSGTLQAKPIAVVSLFVSGQEAQFRKFCTDLDHQGKGYGTHLLRHVLQDTQSQHPAVKRIWCNARKDKTSFYQRFGLCGTNEMFNKGGIDYVIMELKV